MKRSDAFHILGEMVGGATKEQKEALDIAMNDIEYVDLMQDENAVASSIDYESEYHRALEELKMLEIRHDRMKAQIDIVHLIFGNR